MIYSINYGKDKITVKRNEEEIKVFQYNSYYAYNDYGNSYSIFHKKQNISLARIDILNNNDMAIIIWRKDIPKRLLKEIITYIKENYDIKDIYYQDKCFNKIDDIIF